MEGGIAEYWTCSSDKCEGKYYGDANCQIELDEIKVSKNPANHVSERTWDMDEEKHVRKCVCGAKIEEGKHEYTDANDSDCNVCGYKRCYVVNEGANATFELESSNGIVLKADGDHTLFQKLEVDGKVVATENYTVTQGSTIITLKAGYLNTLSVGAQDVKMLFSDGKIAVTKINVKEKVQQNTGNNGNNTGSNNNTGNNTGNNNNTGNAGTSDATTNNVVQSDNTAKSPKTDTIGVAPESVVFVMVMMLMLALVGMFTEKKYINKREK